MGKTHKQGEKINQELVQISWHTAKPKNWYSKYTKSFYNEHEEGKQPDRKNGQRR